MAAGIGLLMVGGAPFRLGPLLLAAGFGIGSGTPLREPIVQGIIRVEARHGVEATAPALGPPPLTQRWLPRLYRSSAAQSWIGLSQRPCAAAQPELARP